MFKNQPYNDPWVIKKVGATVPPVSVVQESMSFGELPPPQIFRIGDCCPPPNKKNTPQWV